MITYIAVPICILLMIGVAAFLKHSCSVSLYRLRNIWLAGLLPLLLGMILSVLGYLVLQSPENLMLGNFIVRFPAVFANASVFLFVLLGAAMAVSNVILIKHEGMAFKNTVGTLLQLIFILGTIIVYQFVCFLQDDVHSKTAVFIFLEKFLPLWLYCLIDYAECFMIGIILMGWLAAIGKPSYDKDFIIIPGCSISKTGGLLPLLRGRVNRAIKYAWEQEIETGNRVSFIPSGGQGPDEVISEGNAMGFYLLSHAAEDKEVYIEKESKNTWENFLFSKRIIDEVKPGAKTAFATTNYHVLRCGILARKAGLEAEGIASSTKLYFWPNGFAREVVAIFVMTKKYHVINAFLLMLLSLAASFI